MLKFNKYIFIFSIFSLAYCDRPKKVSPSVEQSSLLFNEPLVNVSKEEIITDERGREDSFEVSLIRRPEAMVKTYIQSSSPLDVELYLEYLEFTPENWNEPQTVIVKGITEGILDGDSQFFITLSPLYSNDLRFHGYDPPDVKVWNYERDQGVFTFLSKNERENAMVEGITLLEGATKNLELVFGSYPYVGLNMSLTTEDGSVSITPSSLNITYANWRDTFVLSVQSMDDDILQGDRTVLIRLNIDTRDILYTTFLESFSEPVLRIHIKDNEVDEDSEDETGENNEEVLPGINYTKNEINLPDHITLTEGINTEYTYMAVLNTQPVSNVEINVGLVNSPSNLSVESGSLLTFTPDNWDIPKMVRLLLNDDNLSMGTSSVVLNHSISSSDSNYTSLGPQNFNLTVNDNDMAKIIYTTEDGIELSDSIAIIEGLDTELLYSISLNSQPEAEVNISIDLNSAPPNLSIYNVPPGSSDNSRLVVLNFNSSNWNQPKGVRIVLTDDIMYSGDILFTLMHLVTGSIEYMGMNKDVDLLIQEDETEDECNVVPGFEQTPNFDGYGEGTTENPYIICNANQLQAMRDDINAYYALGQNINASSINTNTCHIGTSGTCTGFQPIGMESNKFTGALDGKGFTISNLRININLTSGRSYVGLFGYTLGANIRNISLLNVDIDASYAFNSNSYAGALVGWNGGSSSITNSYSTGNVSCSSSSGVGFSFLYTGGLIGRNHGGSSITNSYSTGNVSISTSTLLGSSVGGLVGWNDGSSITNSYSTGNVSASSPSAYSGGLVGLNERSSITNSYSTGNASAYFSSNGSYVGGLVGWNEESSITNSYSTGNASSFSRYAYTGGMVGYNVSSSITNSYFTGNVSSSSSASGSSFSYAGGLVGYNEEGSSINSYSTGNISSSASSDSSSFSYAGGLIGRNSAGSSIINSYSTGNVSSSASSSFAGIMVGWNSNSITNSYYDIDTATLVKNGSQAPDTAVGINRDILTCVGGFSSPSFKTPTAPNTGSCSSLTILIFFNWQTPFNIGGTSAADEESVRYESNNDGSVTTADDFIWNFGSTTEYPMIASISQTSDEQAVRMASGFLRFSNTTLGIPSEDDYAFFHSIGDSVTSIAIKSIGIQDTLVTSYEIQDEAGNALAYPTVDTNITEDHTEPTIHVDSLTAGQEFYLKVVFVRGSANFEQRYRFKKN